MGPKYNWGAESSYVSHAPTGSLLQFEEHMDAAFEFGCGRLENVGRAERTPRRSVRKSDAEHA